MLELEQCLSLRNLGVMSPYPYSVNHVDYRLIRALAAPPFASFCPLPGIAAFLRRVSFQRAHGRHRGLHIGQSRQRLLSL